MTTKHRHWVVDVAIAARDAAIAEQIAADRAALGPLWPLAPVFRQMISTLSDMSEALTPAIEQIGRAMTDLGAGMQQPPRHAGPVRDVVHEHRPRRHA